MTYYHPKKESAIALANQIELENENVHYCKVELEPNNGWVVVAVPKVYDITHLGEVAEVRHPSGERMTRRPASHKPMPREARPRVDPRDVPEAYVEVKKVEVTAPPWA